MPKQPVTLNKFHGGLNNQSSSRDLQVDEVSVARDIIVEHLGEVKLLGGVADYTKVPTLAGTLTIEKGFGLFVFGHDYDGMEDVAADGTYSASANLVPTEYTIVTDSASSDYHIHSSINSTGGWGSNPVTQIGSSGTFQPSFFAVDGVLRVSDGNFSNTSSNRSTGYYRRKWWRSDGDFSYDKWYGYNGEYVAPTVAASDDSISDISNAGKVFVRPTGHGNNTFQDAQIVFVVQQADDGNWNFYDESDNDEGDNYKFYVSYIYDGGYDGPLATHEDWTVDNFEELDGDAKKLKINVDIGFADDSSWADTKAAAWFLHHPPNVIGMRFWFADIGGGGLLPEEIYALAEIYFDENDKGGLQKIMAGTSSKWDRKVLPVNHHKFTSAIGLTSPPLIFSYEDINGYKHDEVIHARYKTVVVSNRKAYVGNIFQDDQAYGDMMIKSPINGFDIFPRSRAIGASVNDGDEIVKLEAYADRILQFKKGKMHLINVSQEVEFVEDTFAHKGIEHPCQSCATDYGVAWINRFGCYLYDGKQVRNLLEKQGQGRRLISKVSWETFTGAIANKSAIGYLPKKRQIIVVDDIGTNGQKDIFLYDLITGSWVTGYQTLGNDTNFTNFTVSGNGNLVWAEIDGSDDVIFRKYDTNNVSHDHVRLGTNSLDFGNPAQRKKIYSVYVTHNNAGSNKVGLYGEFHSSPSGEVSNTFFFGFLVEDSGSSGSFITQKFNPPALDVGGSAIAFNNVYTMRLFISSYEANHDGGSVRDVPADFTINDITVVYRLKSVR